MSTLMAVTKMSELYYELTGKSKVNLFGYTVHQIRAIRDVPGTSVKKGDLGGWVGSLRLENGNARVSGNAWVSGNAQVYGNAQVSGNAWVYGNAQVSGNAWVYGNAQVYGNAEILQSWHYITVGQIGSEGVSATVFRTKNGKHRLNVGCWSGKLGTLMAEVKRRRQWWHGNEATQEQWVLQYRALRALGKATVARWAEVGGSK